MVVDGSSSEVADNLVRSIQALKAEVSRLHGLLRASQVERTYTSQFILNTDCYPAVTSYRPVTGAQTQSAIFCLL